MPIARSSCLVPLGLALVAGCATDYEVRERELEGNATQWFKGNLHTHSLWSDGNDFPEVISRWYKDQGYDFLAISDHNRLQEGERWMKVDDVVRRGGRTGLKRYREQFGRDWVQTREAAGKLEVRLRPFAEYRKLLEVPGEFLLVQSEEITDKFTVHMNATNIQAKIKPQGGANVREVMRNNLRAVAEQSHEHGEPIVLHLNHPNFGWAVTAEDLAHVTEEKFFEIYNGHPSVHQRGDDVHCSLEMIWDIANTLRIGELKAEPLFGLGTDDSHNYFNASGSTPGRGWVMVRATELTPRALCEALMAGDFYSSSGVLLDEVRFDGKTLSLTIDAEDGVTYTTQFRGTRRTWDQTTEVVEHDGHRHENVTRRYSDDVGEVFATVTGTSPSYELASDELYVRAVVTASVAPQNPVWDGQKAQAWTQPVGWR